MWPMPSVPRPRSFVPGRLVPGRRARAGLLPDDDPAIASAVVDCAVYRDGERQPGERTWQQAIDEVEAAQDGFVWIGLHGPTAQQIAGIAERFGLHPLAVEDAVHAHQRPKMDLYDEHLFAVVKTVHYDDTLPGGTAEVVETGEVMVFVGPRFAITVRHGEHGSLKAVRRKLECDPELLCLGPSVVLHGVLDAAVDSYLVVARALQEDIDEVETAVFAARQRLPDSNSMYVLKREALELRRSTAPLAPVLRTLANSPLVLVHEDVRDYFRDVEDHLSRVVDQVNSFDDLLTTLVNANLARVSVQQNEDMRKISAWVAIAAVPTMVAGIYGMNFEHMPELHWTFGYPLVVFVTVCICFALYRAFKRNGWL
jgi:magnesium transporter